MNELGDFKNDRFETAIKTHAPTVVCALIGGILAIVLAVAVSRDLKTPAVTSTETVAAPASDHADTKDTSDTDAMLSATQDDVTELIGYTIYGAHTLTDESGNAYTADFREGGIVTGTFVSEPTPYRLEMDADGEIYLILSKNKGEEHYIVSYDTAYQMMFTDDTHIYTMTER